MDIKNICICGGGSQGHISAGVIGCNTGYSVGILTRKPQLWSQDFTTIDLNGKEFHATLGTITDNPKDIIPQSDIVYICLPGFAIKEMLQQIAPYVSTDTIIGAPFGGGGFFLALQEVFGASQKSFALQRVPFTGRPLEYGHSGRLKGYKPYLKVATANIDNPNVVVAMLEDWYHTPVYHLSHWLEATLSNSNPLLHPCRMRVMFNDWTPDKIYDRIPWMYNSDWDDASSQCWVECDNELRTIMRQLPMNEQEVPSVLEYYGCKDIKSLTAKMQSIEPFKSVQAHMNASGDGYVVDSSVRYFTEDIPFGLVTIKSFAEAVNIETPCIDDVLEWAQKVMGKEYIVNGRLAGCDINECQLYDPSKIVL